MTRQSKRTVNIQRHRYWVLALCGLTGCFHLFNKRFKSYEITDHGDLNILMTHRFYQVPEMTYPRRPRLLSRWPCKNGRSLSSPRAKILLLLLLLLSSSLSSFLSSSSPRPITPQIHQNKSQDHCVMAVKELRINESPYFWGTEIIYLFIYNNIYIN